MRKKKCEREKFSMTSKSMVVKFITVHVIYYVFIEFQKIGLWMEASFQQEENNFHRRLVYLLRNDKLLQSSIEESSELLVKLYSVAFFNNQTCQWF